MLLQGHSSCLCRGDCKPFCPAELWPCTNTRRRSKILGLNACHILPLQIQLSGGFVLKLQHFTLAVLPFRQMYKACIDRSDSLRFPKSKKKIILVSQMRPLKFISAPRKAKHFIGQLWQLMTASNIGALSEAWQAKWAVFKIPRSVCKRFLPFFLTPSPLSYLCHFSRGLWPSFLVLFS